MNIDTSFYYNQLIIINLPDYSKKTVKIFGNLKLKLNICDVKLLYNTGNKSCLFFVLN